MLALKASTTSEHMVSRKRWRLPALFAGKALVEQGEHLGHVELHVLKVEVFLVVLLHLEKVVELEI